jgi:hypothetical protein
LKPRPESNAHEQERKNLINRETMKDSLDILHISATIPFLPRLHFLHDRNAFLTEEVMGK